MNEPEINITPRAQELLRTLKAQSAWTTRTQLAGACGKSRLSPHESDLLNRLVQAGLVVTSYHQSGPTRVWTNYYRAVQRD